MIAIAAGGVLACVLAVLNLLGGGSDSSYYYYSSSFSSTTVTERGEDGKPRVETRRQESVRTNIPQAAQRAGQMPGELGDTEVGRLLFPP